MSSKVCLVEHCYSSVKGRGMCAAHYKAEQRLGKFDAPNRPTCKMVGCTAVMRYRELCTRHYQIEQRADMLRVKNACAVKPCPVTVYREGHCQAHYVERYPASQVNIPDCRRPRCTQPQHRMGGCERHWKIYQRNELRRTIVPCVVIGCQELASIKGQCQNHAAPANGCLEDGCKGKVRSMGRCQLHYNQFKSAEDFPEDFWAFVQTELGIEA